MNLTQKASCKSNHGPTVSGVLFSQYLSMFSDEPSRQRTRENWSSHLPSSFGTAPVTAFWQEGRLVWFLPETTQKCPSHMATSTNTSRPEDVSKAPPLRRGLTELSWCTSKCHETGCAVLCKRWKSQLTWPKQSSFCHWTSHAFVLTLTQT